MAKYKTIWADALPDIFYHLDRSRYYHRDERLHLSPEDFLEVGERHTSGYTFLLKIVHGMLANNISGTIVARDLYDVLTNDDHLRAWMANKLLEIRLTNNFNLSIKAEEVGEMRTLEETIQNRTVVGPDANDDEAAWNNAAPILMGHAYDDDEPDYSDVPLMEPNPNYKPWTKEQ